MSTDLTKYKDDRKYNLLVKPEDLATQKLFVAQVTVLPVTKEDFHEKPINGRMMPKGHHVDRLAEAGGIVFIAENCGTRKEGEDTWIGRAQGKRRLPDGSWRPSTAHEYEFNVGNRAEEDFLNYKEKYPTEVSKRKHILALKKYARQRASTGARLCVIRQLLSLPIAFGRDNFLRAMVVSRIAVNTDALLESPDMKQAAINQALGVKQDIYGPTEVRDVTPEKEETAALPEPEKEPEEDPGPDFDDIPFGDPESRKFTPEVEEARNWLLEVSGLPDVPKDTQSWIKDFLNGKSDEDDGDINILMRVQKKIKANIPALAGDTI